MRALAHAVLPPLIRAVEIVTALLLFVMMMLTFVDVIGRYVFTAPIFGAAEMIQFLLAMTIFGGLCLVNARDEHITVDLFDGPLERLLPVARRIIIQLFSVVVMGIIAYQLFEFAMEAQRVGTLTVVLEWPFAAVALTVAALSVLSLVAQILGLWLQPKAGRAEGSGGSL